MKPLLLVALVALTACGFQPLYGQGSNSVQTADALNHVEIKSIPDREGQALRNKLIDRFYTRGRPEKPTTVLTITLRSALTDLGVQKDATTTRQELNLTADYTLTDQKGKTLLKGSARSIVSTSKLNAQYATLTAKENASDRALNEVGEQIINRIALYFAEGKEPAQKPIEAPESQTPETETPTETAP